MQLALTAIRWSLRILLVAACLATGTVFYMTMNQPGEVTRYLFGGKSVFESYAPKSASINPSVEETAPRPKLADIAERTKQQAAAKAAQEQQTKAARLKPKLKKQGDAGYQPPTAQRKTLRVGE